MLPTVDQLAIQQQIELLQQQQQQLQATHQQYVNMGMIPPGQQLGPGGFNPLQPAMGNMGPQGAFQFPNQMQQQNVQMGHPNQQAMPHRRNQSAIPNMGIGPPPAPSSGASGGGGFGHFEAPGAGRGENTPSRGGRGGGGGHQRRHSLALADAKKAAELAQQKRTTSGFSFPGPNATPEKAAAGEENQPASQPASTSTDNLSTQGGAARGGRGAHGRSQSMAVGRGGGGAPPGRGAHARSGSRNFEGNWRTQSQSQGQGQEPGAQPQQGFQPGHRARGSTINQSVSSMGGFQYGGGQSPLVQLPGQMMMPQMYPGQQLNPMQMGQLQALQAAQQMNGQHMAGLQGNQHGGGMSGQGQGQHQQQRKTLFTPYLPQATLPALLGDGQLVSGVLRVNKKNRSDAYVTTQDGLLDADIFICGSKDRNRALEGDLVAIELLDVDEVWGQKREKEEKKKRKDITDTRSGSTNQGSQHNSNGDDGKPAEGGIRRRGSLRQRPTQKKNDDVEVEGQSLLLVEEEEISDDHKPLYAGHIVAVIERVAGQMFSGTLGLLRPSSQATKEKQEAERAARDGANARHHEQRQEKPKIVWFKPTDKRVPLIAIPTEQAPRDFVEKHQDYADRIFVACIKRWPITSLHPFGTLVEQLGKMGDLKVETDALLRDNNFSSDDFSDAVLRSVGLQDWTIAKEDEAAVAARRDFRDERVFTLDVDGTGQLGNAIHVKTSPDGKIDVGIHVPDVAHFVKPNSLVDREAKKRGTGVHLLNRSCALLPPKLASDVCSLTPDEERFAVSAVFRVNPLTGSVAEEDAWVGKGIVKSGGKLTLEELDTALSGQSTFTHDTVQLKDLQILNVGEPSPPAPPHTFRTNLVS
ncbi:RNB domain-containing ribonuclease [Candidatus Bathyarchaeota archaeon]|nr:RNB domain-containing ribonuclease [Candidatus Bathyarchaeota archaeon]